MQAGFAAVMLNAKRGDSKIRTKPGALGYVVELCRASSIA